MEFNLKACPYCGSPAEFSEQDLKYSVMCTSCLAEMTLFADREESPSMSNFISSRVAEDWNRRDLFQDLIKAAEQILSKATEYGWSEFHHDDLKQLRAALSKAKGEE